MPSSAEDEEEVPARASRSQRAFSTAADALVRERERDGPRDRDPPPAYDGVEPESTFKNFEKSVRLWCYETDIPKAEARS